MDPLETLSGRLETFLAARALMEVGERWELCNSIASRVLNLFRQAGQAPRAKEIRGQVKEAITRAAFLPLPKTINALSSVVVQAVKELGPKRCAERVEPTPMTKRKRTERKRTVEPLDSRTERIIFCVTGDEREELEQAAKVEGEKLGPFVRSLIFEALRSRQKSPQVRPRETLPNKAASFSGCEVSRG